MIPIIIVSVRVGEEDEESVERQEGSVILRAIVSDS